MASLANIKRRNLTWIGKIKLVNATVISKLIYPARIFSLKPQHCKELSTETFQTLWHPEKTEVLSRNLLIKKKDEGGLKVPDIESRAKAALLDRLIRLKKITEPTELWHKEAIYSLSTKLRNIKPELFDNSMPHKLHPRKKWKTIYDIYGNLNITPQQLEEASQRIIYQLLVENKGPEKAVRLDDWRNTWLMNKKTKYIFTNSERIISYRIKMEGFLTGARKRKQNRKYNDKNQPLLMECEFCRKALETMKHIFQDCTIYKGIFNNTKRLLEKLLSKPIQIDVQQAYDNDYRGANAPQLIKSCMIMKEEIIRTRQKLDIINKYATKQDIEDTKTNIKKKIEELLIHKD